MCDFLSGAFACVGNNAVAAFFQAQLVGDFRGGWHEASEHFGVSLVGILQAF